MEATNPKERICQDFKPNPPAKEAACRGYQNTLEAHAGRHRETHGQRKIPARLGFVEKSYLSIVLGNILRGVVAGRPLIGISLAAKKSGTKFFYDKSNCGRAIIIDPGGWEALDLFYVNNSGGIVDRWINSLPAVRATRNRFKQYKEYLKEAITGFGNENCIKILDLFSGPSRGPIEVISELRAEGMQRISLTCIERNQSAIEKGQRLVRERNLSDQVAFKRYCVKQVPERKLGKKYHIIGTHGGYDYFDDERVKGFTDELGALQEPGGIFISTNMLPHNDRRARFCMHIFGVNI